ncbi:hypothetical protein FDX19_02640 [Citrobacter sp. wls619]|uniref:hypothetical protein n=1 Tax=Citrobacter sp. wls619 TaxID=2576432 RepID=UPI0010C956D3|nr:hypothetical protein [Citrobacter sp. wls619]TKV13253.1 hypothetical protein FDX19_02640 [Citrobacter sp. wls619]
MSCWNRRRETERGHNARGGKLVHPIILSPRRVGLLVDGKPTWRLIDAHHEGEALSRAIHQIDGAKFHGQQPGQSVWNKRVGRFQYRCDKHPGEFGTLCEQVDSNGATEYVCPVCRPRAAKDLPEARVCSPTSIQSREFVKEVMRTYCVEPIESWTATEHVCDRCEHYPLQVRTIGKQLHCRCPLCDQAE